MPLPDGGRTKTSRKRKRKGEDEEERAREEALALYEIYDTDGFDKDFFVLLQTRAPEGQKLGSESPVDTAGLIEEKGTGSSSSNRRSSRHSRTTYRQKKVAPSSSLKKSTSTTPGRDKSGGRKNKTQGSSGQNAFACPNDSDKNGNAASRQPSPALPKTPPATSPPDSAPLNSKVIPEPDIPQSPPPKETCSRAIARENEAGHNLGRTASPSYRNELTCKRTHGLTVSDGYMGYSDTAYEEDNPTFRSVSIPFRERYTQPKSRSKESGGEKGKERGMTVDAECEDRVQFSLNRRDTSRKGKAFNSNQTLGPHMNRSSSALVEQRLFAESIAQSLSPKPAERPPLESLEEGLSSGSCSHTLVLADPFVAESTDHWGSSMSVSPCSQRQEQLEILAEAPALENSSPSNYQLRIGEPDSVILTNVQHPNDPTTSIERPRRSGFYESPGDQAAARESILDHVQVLAAGLPVPASSNNSADLSSTRNKKTQKKPVKARSGSTVKEISKYFPISKAAAGSSLSFPSTKRKYFGLIQETVADDPFRLLVATIFLNKTKGEAANPMFKEVFKQYPTVESLANADVDKLASVIRPLGLHRQRASKIVNLANTWLSDPPAKGKRYRRLGYPGQQDGRDVKPNECLDDEDPRSAWEVAHLPGIGPYAIDSWRIFCRDKLRGLATDYNGAGAAQGFSPEWKSVFPHDKELRAYLSWMWLKEGYSWDMDTGEVTPAKRKLKGAAGRYDASIAKKDLQLSVQSVVPIGMFQPLGAEDGD